MSLPIVIDLPADPRARGRAHGEALRDFVHDHLEAWMANLDGGRADDPRAWLQALLDETDFLTAIRRETPALLEEVEGIAEGAGLPFHDILALQLLDEQWAFAARRRAAAQAHDKCSSFAIRGGVGAPTLIGQTMDLGLYTDSFQVLLRCAGTAGAPPQLVFTLAGMIGLMGVNAAGLGVCVNTLSPLADAGRGLPVAFVLRGALACSRADDAVSFLARVPHASGQHYLVADPQRIASIEASSRGIYPFAGQAQDRVLHTNHPLAPRFAAIDWPARAPNSVARLASLQQRLGSGRVTLAMAEAALTACDDPLNPVCRPASPERGLINFTTGAMISSLVPDAVATQVSFGPPDRNPWQHVPVERVRAAA